MRGFERGCLKLYLDMAIPVTEAPRRFHMATALAVLGATVSRKVYLPVGPHKNYPINPIILVGPSGIGKSEALNIGRDIMDLTAPNVYPVGDSATMPALVHAFTQMPDGQGGFMPRTADTLPEASIISGEGTNIMAKTGEKEGMLPAITKLLEQDDRFLRSLKQDMRAGGVPNPKDPTLHFMLGTTLTWMREMMPHQVFSGGFMRRNTVIHEDAKGRLIDGLPPTLHYHQKEALATAWTGFRRSDAKEWVYDEDHPGILSAILQAKDPTKLSWGEAESYYNGWKKRHNLAAPKDERLIGHHNAMPEHIQRAAISFAVSEGRVKLTPDDFRNGEEWVESVQPDALRILQESHASSYEELTRSLERAIKEHRRITFMELRGCFRIPTAMFDDLIDWGKDTGLLEIDGDTVRRASRDEQGEPEQDDS